MSRLLCLVMLVACGLAGSADAEPEPQTSKPQTPSATSKPAQKPTTRKTEPAPKPAAPRLTVPKLTSAVAVDGSILVDEWKGAVEKRLTGGATLLLRHDTAGLELAIRSLAQGVLCIFLEVQGKVIVLHSSARVGLAIYEQKDGRWSPSRPFDYKYPSAEYHRLHGWNSSVVEPRGPGHVECVISRKLLALDAPSKKKEKPRTQPQEVRIRIVHAAFSGSENPAWPQVAEDDTLNPQLLMGHTPEHLTFEPKTWGVLALDVAPKK